MDFRQLQYFVAVVEEGSVSGASRRVHVAQPALTRQIKLLEDSLGTQLFTRHSQGMQLTITGRALYEDAQDLLDQRQQVIARLAALDNGLSGKLSLGITVTHLWLPMVAELLGAYRKRYNGVAFEVFPLLSGPQLERLQQGKLDAGILYLDDEAPAGLSSRLLHRDSLILAVPESSPLAEAAPNSLSALNDEDFVWGARSASPVYYDRVLSHLHRLGFNPRPVQYGADNIAILSMVAAGLGMAVVPASAGESTVIPGVRYLRMKELDECSMPLCFAWRSDNDSPTLANMIALVDETLSLEMDRK
ncbi:LysR family transcriptional regulator [Marinobacterium nitratireducens]|uniref:LysR family transcriptional regulator n=1 Tax=Marinobacterium nitratireducens TaxID=518897 RepID=A0A918DQZ3_9GAMM|nr:LysR family transcriptional regulator [Marinobacterium nitratireducens]GGO79348.1 LysR family transcriptional regulator [Marinobacterium nitratireducens]